LDAVTGPADDGLARGPHRLLDYGLLRGAEAAEHVIDGAGLAGRIDADPQPGVLLGAQVVADVAQPLLSAVAAPGPHPQLAERQVDVVADDEQVRYRHLVEVQHLADAAAAEVHERLRLHEEELFAVLDQLGDLPLEARLEPAGPGALRQVVD